MAVSYVSTWRTEPGKFNEHLEGMTEALGHLRRLGLQAVLLQSIAGSDAGTMSHSVNFANYAAFATDFQKLNADPEWQEFYSDVMRKGPAVEVEASLFQDVDASFQPAADRPLGVIAATQWRPLHGRGADFLAQVEAGLQHVQRLGGTARVMQSVNGLHPNTVLIPVTFADLDAWGAYSDSLAADEQWQEFWAGAMGDPTADLVRAGVFVNISGD